MRNLAVLVCLFVGIASVPGSFSLTSHLVAREIVQRTSPLHFEARQKRDAVDLKKEFEWFIQPNQTWCFCGLESWLIKLLKVNISEAVKCAKEAKLNLTVAEKDNVMSALAKIGRASTCVYNCVFEKLNLIDSNSALKKDAIKDLFKDKVFQEEGLEDAGSRVVQRCLTTGTGNTLTMQVISALTKGSSCGEKAYEFISCLLLEMIEDCPENKKRNDVDHCSTLYSNYRISRQFSQAANRGRNL